MITGDREIYPSAPLEFVACEIRYPISPALGEDVVFQRLHRAFYDWLPIVEPAVETTVVVGPGGPPLAVTRSLRFLARDRRLSVHVSPNLISVETTAYTQYEDFRSSIERALSSVLKARPAIAGLVRVGLRYIDEIRAPGADTDELWTRYIDPRLSSIVGLHLEGVPPVVFDGLAQYDFPGNHHAVMRYGARQGQSVGNGPLRRREKRHSDSYFLIDIDSFWEADGDLPEFSVQSTLERSDDLHRPVRKLFEASITEHLRVEVLRRVSGGG